MPILLILATAVQLALTLHTAVGSLSAALWDTVTPGLPWQARQGVGPGRHLGCNLALAGQVHNLGVGLQYNAVQQGLQCGAASCPSPACTTQQISLITPDVLILHAAFPPGSGITRSSMHHRCKSSPIAAVPQMRIGFCVWKATVSKLGLLHGKQACDGRA